MEVRICGTAEPAFAVELQAEAVGPNVTLTTSTIDWGKATVLQHVVKTLTLTNASLIPATYHAMTRKPPPNTSFAIPTPTATLAPGEVRELEISEDPNPNLIPNPNPNPNPIPNHIPNPNPNPNPNPDQVPHDLALLAAELAARYDDLQPGDMIEPPLASMLLPPPPSPPSSPSALLVRVRVSVS